MYRNPPSTGPMIAAPVNVAVQSATTCGNCSWVEIKGGIERRAGASIASAAPIAAAIANIGNTLVGSFRLYSASADGAQAAGEDEHGADASAVEPVRHPAADEHEQHGGDELGEAQQADRELVAGDVVRLLEQHRHHQVEADRPERAWRTR